MEFTAGTPENYRVRRIGGDFTKIGPRAEFFPSHYIYIYRYVRVYLNKEVIVMNGVFIVLFV